jgi:hypothetical protein
MARLLATLGQRKAWVVVYWSREVLSNLLAPQLRPAPFHGRGLRHCGGG